MSTAPPIAITVHDLGKQYRLGSGRGTYRTLRESLAGLLGRPFPGLWERQAAAFRRRPGHHLGPAGGVPGHPPGGDSGDHRQERGRQDHPSQSALPHHGAHRGAGDHAGPGGIAPGGGHRFSPGAHRPGEHLSERRHPGDEPPGGPAPVRGNRGLCRDRAVSGHAAEALLHRHGD